MNKFNLSFSISVAEKTSPDGPVGFAKIMWITRIIGLGHTACRRRRAYVCSWPV